MERICKKEELLLYRLEGKWNDYIGVQKIVLKVLREESFFVDDKVINQQTGMVIRINAKGIKETIGPGKRFQALPKVLKEEKIATIRHLKQIIARAELVCDNVPNRHYENGYTYAYLKANIIIDDKLVGIKITIKKKISVNWFWIHNIDEIKC